MVQQPSGCARVRVGIGSRVSKSVGSVNGFETIPHEFNEYLQARKSMRVVVVAAVMVVVCECNSVRARMFVCGRGGFSVRWW